MNLNTIRKIKSIKLLEQKFKENGITSKKEKIELLKKAMGNPAIGHPANLKLSEKYEIILGTFASGVWKTNYTSFEKEKHAIPRE